MSDGLVAGRFRLQRLRGSGGTAAVFEAEDVQAGRLVALKLLHPHLAADRVTWEAFFEEVRAAGSIQHPNLADVFDAGVEEADPPVVWIAMELVDGVSLAEHVQMHGALEVRAALTVTAAVLDALEAAHMGGVVHRDITPANVMFDPALLAPDADADAGALAASVRLLDFGLADVPGRTTRGADPLLSAEAAEGQVVASVSYASPEQLAGEPVDERSDLYQVGGVLYFALVGRPPFEGSGRSVARAHLSAPPPVPSATRPGVPRAVDRIVTTALLKRPAERYADAGDMRREVADAGRAPAPGWGAAASASPSVTGADGAGRAAPTAVTRVFRTMVPVGAGSATAEPGADRAGHSRMDRALDSRAEHGGGLVPVLVGLVLVAVVSVAGVAAMGTAGEASPTVSPTVVPTTAPPSSPPVSAPPEVTAPMIVVPEIRGMALNDARAALRAVGFDIGEVTVEDSSAPSDIVLGSSPESLTSARAGAPIAVRVASGRNAIPGVAGLTATEAVSALTAAGFAAQTAQAWDPAAVIASTTPVAGEIVAVGSVISLVTVAPTPSPAPSPSATPTPRPSPTPSTTPSPGP